MTREDRYAKALKDIAEMPCYCEPQYIDGDYPDCNCGERMAQLARKALEE